MASRIVNTLDNLLAEGIIRGVFIIQRFKDSSYVEDELVCTSENPDSYKDYYDCEVCDVTSKLVSFEYLKLHMEFIRDLERKFLDLGVDLGNIVMPVTVVSFYNI